MEPSHVRGEIDRILRVGDGAEFADALMDLIDCNEEDLYDRLPAALKTAVAVNAFSLESTSGGFYQLIANSAPALLHDIRSGLRTIGATEAVRFLDDICNKFPNGVMPDDPAERFRILGKLDGADGGKAFRKLDNEYGSTGEDVLALLKMFVARRQDEVATTLAEWSQQR